MNTRMIPRSLSMVMLSSRLFAHPRLLSRTTQNLVPFVLSKRNFSTNNAHDEEEKFEEIKKLSPYNFEEKHSALNEKYKGMSESPFSDETIKILLQPVNSHDIEVRADGMIYMPEIKYRRILLQAFGPGGWALRQTSDYTVIDGNLCVSFALYCLGRYVAEAVGEQQLTSGMTFPTSIESAKSNALVRCCKDLGIASELWDPHFINEWKLHHRVSETVNGRLLYKKKPLGQIDSSSRPQSTSHYDPKTPPLNPTIKNVNPNTNINASTNPNVKTNLNPYSTPNHPNTNTSSNTNPSSNINPKPSPSQSQSQNSNANVNPKPNTTTNQPNTNEVQSKHAANANGSRLSTLFRAQSQSETQTQQSQQTETQPKVNATPQSSPKLSYLFRPQSETQSNTTTQNPTEPSTEKPIKIENNPPKTTTTTTQNQSNTNPPPQKAIPPFLSTESTIESTTSHKPTLSEKHSEKPSEKREPNPLFDDGDGVFQSPFRAAPTPSSNPTQKTETSNFELMLDQKVPPEYKKVAHQTWKHVFNDPSSVRYLIWAASSMRSEHLKGLAQQALEFLKKNPTRFPTAHLAQ